jgi:hypothetical protein
MSRSRNNKIRGNDESVMRKHQQQATVPQHSQEALPFLLADPFLPIVHRIRLACSPGYLLLATINSMDSTASKRSSLEGSRLTAPDQATSSAASASAHKHNHAQGRSSSRPPFLSAEQAAAISLWRSGISYERDDLMNERNLMRLTGYSGPKE